MHYLLNVLLAVIPVALIRTWVWADVWLAEVES